VNRSDIVKGIVWLDQIAARAKEEAATLRHQLDEDARAEYEEQGTAPTWRMPEVATIQLSVSKEAVVVGDERVFAEWVAKRYPDEVYTVTRVRQSFTTAFTERHVLKEPEGLVDSATGEVVPGLVLRQGGIPLGVSIRPTADVKAAYAAVADHALRRLAVDAGPSMPVVLAELEAADAHP
jgi:hypothetical protein